MSRTTTEYRTLSDKGEPPASIIPPDEVWTTETELDPMSIVMQFDPDEEIDELSEA